MKVAIGTGSLGMKLLRVGKNIFNPNFSLDNDKIL